MTESEKKDPYSVIGRDYLYPVGHELFLGFHARVIEKAEEQYEDNEHVDDSEIINGDADSIKSEVEDPDDSNTIQAVCDAIALYDFEPLHENELGVFEGQTLWILSEASHGWLVAYDELSGKSGLVPESYVTLIQ
ncbi:Shk1 kinase binding protein 5 [Schizosaccharomyces cryophilus OY26]|uniref:Shk1 kinase binding protein 5 n=1 Tax=Schizosaccharomyces cryophilus (strain OY26 / ATCC MYA-4695 / CBS 11777 / NBRC 106824 / NRRL Y48691) TaxID=653667 RepID=S9WYF5_SCHCR|nr:Shk1 kinase binding protein 5 [Schizosaccharomyces cryophilus OY26]EPY49772.1 Shk1 kinase binding protein 5 [Schizosaccharomyces cryophilus OY26]